MVESFEIAKLSSAAGLIQRVTQLTLKSDTRIFKILLSYPNLRAIFPNFSLSSLVTF